MNYLITGLPRSKTAWMSVVASTVTGSFCQHEPMSHMKSWECCFEIWKSGQYPYLGVSDAHLGFHLERVIAEAAPRILIIRRDLAQVKESMRTIIASDSNYCDLLAESLNKYLDHPSVAWVYFEGLRNVQIVKYCLHFLMPGCRVDERRITELMALNVQADLKMVWQRAVESRSDVNRILGAESIPGLHLSQ